MSNRSIDLRAEDASQYIEELVSFMGRSKLDKQMGKHHRRMSSSGQILQDYYKNKYQWLEAFDSYFKLTNQGKSIKKHITQELMMLAGDAFRITTLSKLMSETAKYKYQRTLVAGDRTNGYYFELLVAWHFYAKGCDIRWNESCNIRQCEYSITNSDVRDFNVECKRVSVDASRKISREKCNVLFDKMFQQLEKRDCQGTIDVILHNRLQGDDIMVIADAINTLASEGGSQECKTSFGKVRLSLKKRTHEVVEIPEMFQVLMDSKDPSSYAIICTRKENNKPVDPFVFSVQCEKTDSVIDGIAEKLKQASKQLPVEAPGLISCFLEDIWDMRDLASGSSLQEMTCFLLNKAEFSHVFAVSYCSEPRTKNNGIVTRIDNQALSFRNQKCVYPELQRYQFLSDPECLA